MKALLEVTGLGLCDTVAALMDFVQHTLLYCQSSFTSDITGVNADADQAQYLVMDVARKSFEFLRDSNIIEVDRDHRFEFSC